MASNKSRGSGVTNPRNTTAQRAAVNPAAPPQVTNVPIQQAQSQQLYQQHNRHSKPTTGSFPIRILKGIMICTTGADTFRDSNSALTRK